MLLFPMISRRHARQSLQPLLRSVIFYLRAPHPACPEFRGVPAASGDSGLFPNLSDVSCRLSTPVSPFLATDPKNQRLSLIIATLPELPFRKSFACHTCAPLPCLSASSREGVPGFLFAQSFLPSDAHGITLPQSAPHSHPLLTPHPHSRRMFSPKCPFRPWTCLRLRCA
jgi:hypothetical protein